MILGNSGCKIEFLNCVVKKTSKDISYNQRLQKQIEKQDAFMPLDCFVAPKVIHRYFEDKLFICEMEYYNGMDVLDYLQILDKSDFDEFINKLLFFLDFEIKQAIISKVPQPILIDKLLSLKKYLPDYIADYWLNWILANDVIMPVGGCHGDFTLSNMLIYDDKIVLIDFLDTFVDSPILDIVKLQQDTKYLWSLQIKQNIDYNKTLLYLNYFDNILSKFIDKQNCSCYSFFEFMNLARLLPYIKDQTHYERTVNYICQIR